ncbi:polysaccharide biosynthesis protein [Cohnella suwonensis]|uniref:Polysaccharide biosynthesis protein n=1 Tax=Cohnella suwonensis TaxID=696072 RepID=A0ABW0LU49_9BACL
MRFQNTIILITGGTGVLGYGLVRQLLPQNPAKIIIYSRNEANQVAMSRVFEDSRISYYIGDVRDKAALSKACEAVDYVFHLAEINHVALCENQPEEALKTNIGGILNLIEVAAANEVKKVIYWSSDKAVPPSSLYGLSKAIGEKLIIHANTFSSAAAFLCVRGGTLFETRHDTVRSIPGSSMEPNGIRFFLHSKDAARLLLKAASIGKGGEVLLPVMPLFRTNDLIEILTGSQLDRAESAVKPVQPQSGETSEDILLSEYERTSTIVYDDDFLIILPAIIPGLKTGYASCPPLTDNSTSANSPILSVDQFRSLLVQNGYIQDIQPGRQ